MIPGKIQAACRRGPLFGWKQVFFSTHLTASEVVRNAKFIGSVIAERKSATAAEQSGAVSKTRATNADGGKKATRRTRGQKSPIKFRRNRRRGGNNKVMGRGQNMPRHRAHKQPLRIGSSRKTRLTGACQFVWVGLNAQQEVGGGWGGGWACPAWGALCFSARFD